MHKQHNNRRFGYNFDIYVDYSQIIPHLIFPNNSRISSVIKIPNIIPASLSIDISVGIFWYNLFVTASHANSFTDLTEFLKKESRLTELLAFISARMLEQTLFTKGVAICQKTQAHLLL